MREWISVEDKLPSEDKEYLVVWKLGGGPYRFAIEHWVSNISKEYPFKYIDSYRHRKDGGWVVSDPEEDFEDKSVKYWMPIPEIPKEDI